MEVATTPKLSPQCCLVLSRLRGAWPSGVHSHDFRSEYGVGDPAKRVCELKDAGYEIRIEQANRGKRNGVLYILHRPEYAEAVPPSTASPSPVEQEAGIAAQSPTPSADATLVSGEGASSETAPRPAAASLPSGVAAGKKSSHRSFARGPGEDPVVLPADQWPVREVDFKTLDAMCQASVQLEYRLGKECTKFTPLTLEDVVLLAELRAPAESVAA